MVEVNWFQHMMLVFSSLRGFWRNVLGDSFPACALKKNNSSGGQLVYSNSTLYARIGLQWLSELRRPWPSFPRRDACEFVSLIGSHIMPGQHSQPTPTLLGQGCLVCVFRNNLPPTFLAEWPGSFTCHCGNAGWNGHRIRVQTES